MKFVFLFVCRTLGVGSIEEHSPLRGATCEYKNRNDITKAISYNGETKESPSLYILAHTVRNCSIISTSSFSNSSCVVLSRSIYF